MFTNAKRFEPRELSALDLEVADARVVWATGATASSSYSSSYAPSAACGPPSVYPEEGDRYGTWLADGKDRSPWLELTFPERGEVRGLLVCETCGPGAVTEIRDVDRDTVLYEGRVERLEDTRTARLFHVPLAPGTTGPVRLRLTLTRSGSAYHQIDAVAVLTAPLEAILAAPPRPPLPHRRYAPSEVASIDLRGDWRLLWATGARASSEYGPRYAASQALGPPKVFPESGDRDGTWLSKGDDRGAWLELEFGDHERVHGLVVLETCGAGAVVQVTDDRSETLFLARREPAEDGEARLLHVPLDPRAAPERIRLWVSSAETEYREIDAVALLAAPFEELFQPAPPPPPPPPPGAPPGGFTIFEGALVGGPLVHATLCASNGGRAANHGGPVRLRLDDGTEVALETGRTTIYGGASARRRGTWPPVSEALPWLAAAFEGGVPGEVILGGRWVDPGTRVWVAGTPSGARPQGFRESADGVPPSLVAVAVSTVPLAETDFAAEGVDGFEREARPHRPPVRVAHPLRRTSIAMLAVAIACLPTTVTGLVVGGGTLTAVSGIAAYAGLYAAIFAIELAARMAFVPSFVRGPSGGLHDRKPAFPRPSWTLIGAGTFFALTVTPIASAIHEGWSAAHLLGLAFAMAAPTALLRLVLFARIHAPSFLEGLRLALASAAKPAPGATGRFTGRIAEGTFTRTEVGYQRSEHLGTDKYTQSDGHVIQRERYSNWVERRTSAHGPSPVRLVVGDTPVVAEGAPRTTDVGLECLPPEGLTGFMRFASEHGEGDEATLIGAVRGDSGGAMEIDATHLVLGSFGALRRRVAMQAFAFVTLALLVAAGGLFFVL